MGGKRKFKQHDNFTSTRARGIVNGSGRNLNGSGRIMLSRRYPLLYIHDSGSAGITGFPTGMRPSSLWHTKTRVDAKASKRHFREEGFSVQSGHRIQAYLRSGVFPYQLIYGSMGPIYPDILRSIQSDSMYVIWVPAISIDIIFRTTPWDSSGTVCRVSKGCQYGVRVCPGVSGC